MSNTNWDNSTVLQVGSSPSKDDSQSAAAARRKRSAWIFGGSVAALALTLLLVVGLAIGLSGISSSSSTASDDIRTGSIIPFPKDNSTREWCFFTLIYTQIWSQLLNFQVRVGVTLCLAKAGGESSVMALQGMLSTSHRWSLHILWFNVPVNIVNWTSVY